MNFGLYFLTILNTFYKDGRPFWNVAKITSNGHCLYDFGSPSVTTFILTFFYSYILIMYRFKYT